MTDVSLFRELIRTCFYSAITLYMMVILARWVAPYLSIDLTQRNLRWVGTLTDPLLSLIRRTLPPMGFTDWAPVAALLMLWVARVLLTGE